MPEWRELDDCKLLEEAQKGQVAAFGELYERHAETVYRYLQAHLSNPLDAEDLTEDVFLRSWRSLPFYRQQGIPFPAYLLRIARNALTDHYRRSARRGQPASLEAGETMPDPRTEPSAAVLARLERQELVGLLQGLNEDYRTVLALRFFSELAGTSSVSAKCRFTRTMPPCPRGYSTKPPLLSIGLTRSEKPSGRCAKNSTLSQPMICVPFCRLSGMSSNCAWRIAICCAVRGG